VSIETLPDLELLQDTLVLEGLDFTPECEHVQHRDPGWAHHHAGPAAWLVAGMCPSCPNRAVYLVCDRWRVSLVENPDAFLTCTSCGKHSPWGVDGFGMTFTPIPGELR
jgi:hypothetical protein